MSARLPFTFQGPGLPNAALALFMGLFGIAGQVSSASAASARPRTAPLIASATARPRTALPAATASETPSTPEVAAAADTAATEPDSAEAEDAVSLKTLSERVRYLERGIESKKPEDPKKKSETVMGTAGTVTAGKDGFGLVSADKQSVIRFRYFQQVDGRYFLDDAAKKLPNTLALARVRPIFDGTIGKFYNFRFMPEYSGTTAVLDAYGELAFFPVARLRAGKSKTPVGLERLKSSTDMDLIEFSNATSLTPNYDIGVSLNGENEDKSFSYAVGVFNGAIDGTSRDEDLNDDKELMGRFFVFPFLRTDAEIARDLGVGLAVSYGRKEGDFAHPEVPVYRSESQQVFFRYRAEGAAPGDTVRASGDGYRINPQGYWYFSSTGLFGEYIQETQQLIRGDAAAGKETLKFTNRAWNATVSRVVTGETPSFKGVKPRRSLSFTEPSSYGALELVLRASQIKLDKNLFNGFANPDVSANSAFTWTGGVNWYLSNSVKWSVSYAWTTFKGGAPDGTDRVPERILFSRLQTSF